MAIESFNAAKTQLEAEARREFFPGIEIIVGVAKKAAGLAGFELPKFAELCVDSIQRNSRENLAYLFESLVEDVKRIGLKQENFESASKDQREALNELVSEAVIRAAEAKSKERVRRIARVLANAFRSGPKQSYETERELIDVASQLADSDAAILGVMMKHQGLTVKSGPGVADVNLANETWKSMRLQNKEFTSPHIHVSCARLQAHGLIIRMDRNTSALDLATNAYSITTFGVQFCEWCLQEAVG
jgi:hypothetical protein